MIRRPPPAFCLSLLLLVLSPAAPAVRADSPADGGHKYSFSVYARDDVSAPWIDIGHYASEKDAQAVADYLNFNGFDAYVRRISAGSPEARRIGGEWASDWGPVTFEVKDGGDGKTVSFVGHWDQGEKMRGQITEGAFDPGTRKLTFRYYQDWNDQHGHVEMTLSEDGRTLSGTWTQESGSGGWEMTRK